MAEGAIFEVEKILGQRVVQGKKEYLIKWKGFGPEEYSWEPQSNLIGCQELLKDFITTLQVNKSHMVQQTPDSAKKPLEFTKVRTPRKQGKPAEKDDKEPYKILHRRTQPPPTPIVTEVATTQVSTGCPVLHRNTFGFLIVLSVIIIVIIIFGSRIPGVETKQWHNK